MTLFVLCARPLFALSEAEHLRRIESLKNAPYTELCRAIDQFAAAYPRSNHAPQVRLVRAERNPDPAAALQQFRDILRLYSRYGGNDVVRLRIIELLDTMARWNDLDEEARQALAAHPSSVHRSGYLYFRSRALFFLQRYGDALPATELALKTKQPRDRESELLLRRGFLLWRTGRGDAPWLGHLAGVHRDFAEAAPTTLYLHARHCLTIQDKPRARAALRDLVKRWPRSPEALLALPLLTDLEKENLPEVRDYWTLASNPIAGLTPERPVDTREGRYAVRMGPFYNLQEANNIKRLLEKEFAPVFMIKDRSGFTILAGSAASTDDAMTLKIRLAEEFGFNGSIVTVNRQQGAVYFYGE